MANPTLSLPKQAAGWRMALLSTSLMMGLSFGQSAAEKENSARMERMMEAQQMLLDGDAAYNAGKYDQALQEFLKARTILPNAPATAELRDAATERYATAAVQQASELSRKGDVPGAKQLIDQVLTELPGHAAATAMLGKLDDPIRTNPALTKEHSKNVDEVRRTLYEADGFFQDGRYDMAKTMYEDVLRIDATNKAARRGLEKIAAQKSNYLKAASDHTRAEMLMEVDKAWETPVPDLNGPDLLDPTEEQQVTKIRFVSERMRMLIIPRVELEQVSIEEAVDFVRSQSRALDTTTLNSVDKGFNIILNLGDGSSEITNQIRAIRFDLKLQNVPVKDLLEMICAQTRTRFAVDEFAVSIRPVSSDSVELITRTYKVPPDFLATENAGAAPAAAANPFDDAPAEGLSAKRMTALEKLNSFGVRIPEGGSATFNASTSTLMVRTTLAEHDMVQQVVDTVAQTEPVQVVVRCTMMKIQNVELNELGFDFIMGTMGLGGGGMGGNDALFLGGGTQGNGDAISASTTLSPLTSSLRSGDSAISDNSIDALIRNSSAGFSPSPSRAPGALSVLANNLNGTQVEMLMRGFNQKKGVDVVTKPATVARSGQTAKIEIIQEMIYPTAYEPPELPNTVGGDNFVDNTGQAVGQNTPLTPITPAMPTAFAPRNVGTTLEINPIVSPDRRFIELSIKPEIVTFDGFVNYGTPISSGSSSSIVTGGVTSSSSTFGKITDNRILQPIFSVIRANTAVTIADGATMVIGGMVEEKVQDVEDKVPVLGDIPLVGRLFRSKARQPIRTTVLIMVQVELQDPSGKPYRNR